MKKPLFVTAIILLAPMIHAAILAEITAPAALSVNPISLPLATQHQPYTAPALTASGGAPPYTWTVTSPKPALPEGMTIDSSTGVISSSHIGSKGRYQFQVQVKDSSGAIATEVETINIAADPPPPTIAASARKH